MNVKYNVLWHPSLLREGRPARPKSSLISVAFLDLCSFL